MKLRIVERALSICARWISANLLSFLQESPVIFLLSFSRFCGGTADLRNLKLSLKDANGALTSKKSVLEHYDGRIHQPINAEAAREFHNLTTDSFKGAPIEKSKAYVAFSGCDLNTVYLSESIHLRQHQPLLAVLGRTHGLALSKFLHEWCDRHLLAITNLQTGEATAVVLTTAAGCYCLALQPMRFVPELPDNHMEVEGAIAAPADDDDTLYTFCQVCLQPLFLPREVRFDHPNFQGDGEVGETYPWARLILDNDFEIAKLA
jgi:hypothetical protein